MDGFHYSRAQLDAMDDPEEAHRRRGAAFTFDAEGYVALIDRLREPIETGREVKAPSFDHARKDPVMDDIVIGSDHWIVVIEGNYVALDLEPWSEAARKLDALIFVEVEEVIAIKRLAARHVAAGIAADEEEGLARASGSDLDNAREIVARRISDIAFEVVVSRDDETWAKKLEI